ncbi:MAG: DUF6768 family protein [Planctomycetota bacterium]|jgi:hypothetical protein
MSQTPGKCCPDDPGRDDTLCDIVTLGFCGRLKWMAVICWIYVLLFTAVAVVAAVRFFQVEDLRLSIMYATVFLTALLFVAITKMWYWMLANRNSLKRDIRRLAERMEQLKAG